jgi:hypothetical protein
MEKVDLNSATKLLDDLGFALDKSIMKNPNEIGVIEIDMKEKTYAYKDVGSKQKNNFIKLHDLTIEELRPKLEKSFFSIQYHFSKHDHSSTGK